jgi:uncharacterized protein (DUF924 family)
MTATSQRIGLADVERLLGFWFGEDGGDDAAVAARQAALWWGKNPDTDLEVEAAFGDVASRAAAGTLDHWTGFPRGRLALILALDQLPRVIHRGAPAAFAGDEAALRVAERGLASGVDRLLQPIERVFFYLPFEHSESLADQERSVELFRALAASVPPQWRETFDGFLDYAVRHHDVIARFGRFPHRNQVLGRPSTAAELVFLAEPGSSF